MPGSQLQYLPVIAVLILVTVSGSVILFLNRILGPRVRTPVKQATFECGSDPSGRRGSDST